MNYIKLGVNSKSIDFLKSLQYIVVIFIINIAYIVFGYGQTAYESYLLRSSTTWPVHEDLGDREIQGVTHDHDNWYFTWTNKDPNIGYLSKIPLGVNLADCVLGAITPCPQSPGQKIVNMNQFAELKNYWHWGDPDHYQYNGTDYIVVPISGSPSIIAIFRASNLSLALVGKLTQATHSVCDGNLGPQRSIGWCAIHPKTGDLYTSEDFDYASCIPGNCDDQGHVLKYPRELLHYSVPWSSIPLTGFGGAITLESVDTPRLLLGKQGEFLELYNMQGGEFTQSGELLYISCGSGCCGGEGVGQVYRSDGIYVFESNSCRAINQSNNHRYNNNQSYFDYNYILGCDGCSSCIGGSWSPEGLTIWDLDNEKDPLIRGQLHVLLFHCQVALGTKSCSDNEAQIQHFGGRLYVDPSKGINRALPTSLGDAPLPGGLSLPFKSFDYTYKSYPVWDGAEIVLKPGSYSAVGTYSTRVRIVSQGGSSILGR